MPHLINRDDLVKVDLGPCDCEDTSKHPTDTVWIRRKLSYPDQLYLADAMAVGNAEALWTLFNLRVAKWNIVDAKGKPIPLSRATWNNLDEAFAEKIQKAMTDVQDEPLVPNESSAPSADS